MNLKKLQVKIAKERLQKSLRLLKSEQGSLVERKDASTTLSMTTQ